MPWDESESDGSFSLASILDQIKKDSSIYASQTQHIKSHDYNNSRYESFKKSLSYRFMQALRSNSTLKILTNIVNDPKEPTNQIEECYVKCRSAATTAKLKVANAALIHFSITLVKNSHRRVEHKTPLEFAKAQYKPNVVARML